MSEIVIKSEGQEPLTLFAIEELTDFINEELYDEKGNYTTVLLLVAACEYIALSLERPNDYTSQEALFVGIKSLHQSLQGARPSMFEDGKLRIQRSPEEATILDDLVNLARAKLADTNPEEYETCMQTAEAVLEAVIPIVEGENQVGSEEE